MTATCRAPSASRIRSRRRPQGVSPAKHSGNWGKRRRSHRDGARKRGAAGGCFRTGSTHRLVRHHTWTGNRQPGLRAGTMGRAAPSCALQIRRWPRQDDKVKMRGPRLVKVVSGHLEWPLLVKIEKSRKAVVDVVTRVSIVRGNK